MAKRWLIALILLGLLGLSFVFRAPLAHVQLPGERLFEVAGIPITNTMIAAYLASLVLLAFAWAATRDLKLVPGGLQNLWETIIEALLNLCEGVAGRERGRQFFPLVATIFLFILTANWMGLLPGYGTIYVTVHEHGEELHAPLLRSASTDLNVTVGLALITVFMVQFYGVRNVGAKAYFSRFINFSGPNLMLKGISFFMGILEIISELSRVISLSFRLFGNVFAGEVLLAVIGFLIPFVAVLPFYGLELFVGAIQAFIFAILALVFMTLGSLEHTGGDGHEAHAGEH